MPSIVIKIEIATKNSIMLKEFFLIFLKKFNLSNFTTPTSKVKYPASKILLRKIFEFFALLSYNFKTMKKISEKGFAPIFILTIISALLIIGAFLLKNQLRKENETAGEESFLEGLKDCKNSLDCLAQAAKDCTPAKAYYKLKVNIFGVIQTTESIFAIKGKQGEKCFFYLKYKKIDLEFPPNAPEENVQQMKAIYKALEGRDGICKFEPEKLFELLERWKDGKFSSEDFNNAECQGKYFEAPSEEEYRGKRIPANAKEVIEAYECSGEIIERQDDNTACFENQKDIGTVKGIELNGKPVQCCVSK